MSCSKSSALSTIQEPTVCEKRTNVANSARLEQGGLSLTSGYNADWKWGVTALGQVRQKLSLGLKTSLRVHPVIQISSLNLSLLFPQNELSTLVVSSSSFSFIPQCLDIWILSPLLLEEHIIFSSHFCFKEEGNFSFPPRIKLYQKCSFTFSSTIL